jgi:cell division protein FtsB
LAEGLLQRKVDAAVQEALKAELVELKSERKAMAAELDTMKEGQRLDQTEINE